MHIVLGQVPLLTSESLGWSGDRGWPSGMLNILAFSHCVGVDMIDASGQHRWLLM